MTKALVTAARALGQLIHAHFHTFDRETSDLINSLAIWVEKYQSK